jgi:hypothetical protein
MLLSLATGADTLHGGDSKLLLPDWYGFHNDAVVRGVGCRGLDLAIIEFFYRPVASSSLKTLLGFLLV